MSEEVLELDLTDYKDKFGAYVPPGEYLIRVDDAEVDRNGENPCLIVYSTITEGEFAGMNLVDRLYITANSMFRIVGALQALGFKTPRGRLQIPLRELPGRSVKVAVEDNTYKGRTRAQIASYINGSAVVPQVDKTDLTDLVPSGLDEFKSSVSDDGATVSVSAKPVDLSALDM
jgi:hypothetical protein